MAFSDLYPLAAFTAIADASWWRASDLDMKREGPAVTHDQRRAARELDDADQVRLKNHDATVFRPALLAHLQTLRAAGQLKPTGGTKGRDCWIADAWNAFVAGEEDDYHTTWLIDAIAKGAFTMTFVRMDDQRRGPERERGVHVPPASDKVKAAWEKICQALDSGTSGTGLDDWRMEANDANTGDRCEMTFRSWEGMLMRRNERHELEPARDVEAIPLVAVPVPVPTGQLLITDAFRIDAFNDAMDLGDAEYREASLDSEKGCVRRTELYAARFGVGFCQTTNTTINVRVSNADGSIAFFSNEDILTPGWTTIEGDFDCGVWSIMALDRETAERLIKAGGENEAPVTLDRLIAHGYSDDERDTAPAMAGFVSGTYMSNILRLDVRPGTWTLHSGHGFDERVDHAAFGLPADARPWAILQSPRS